MYFRSGPRRVLSVDCQNMYEYVTGQGTTFEQSSSWGTYRLIVLILKPAYVCADIALSNAVLIIYQIVIELRQFKHGMILANSYYDTAFDLVHCDVR